MFGSTWSKLGGTLKRAVINGGQHSSSSSVTHSSLFKLQIQNFVIVNSRVTSIFSSFSTDTSNSSDLTSDSDSLNSFIVSYLINSCGLTQDKAITASKKLKFKTTSNPDSVLFLLKSYEFTQPHISKLISKVPSILSANPDKTLKPTFEFFKSKGICEIDLVNFISRSPGLLRQGLNKSIIPSFDILKSIVQSDENAIKTIKRDSWLLSIKLVTRVVVNVQNLRSDGVPETNISKYLIKQPRVFTGDTHKFRKIVEKTKQIGFNPSRRTFLVAIHALTSMSEANWRKKMDVYKRWGWSEDQIQSAFRRNPRSMAASEEKIMAVMNFLVNEMGYDSSSIAEYPLIIDCSLKERITPRCSVIRILVSKGLIKKMISLYSVSSMVEKPFLEKFVKKFEQEVPELIKVFQGKLSYQELLHN